MGIQISYMMFSPPIRLIDDDVKDGTTQMVDGSKDQNTNYFYNIDNILVFERPFHNKNVQWRLMKI